MKDNLHRFTRSSKKELQHHKQQAKASQISLHDRPKMKCRHCENEIFGVGNFMYKISKVDPANPKKEDVILPKEVFYCVNCLMELDVVKELQPEDENKNEGEEVIKDEQTTTAGHIGQTIPTPKGEVKERVGEDEHHREESTPEGT